MMNRLTHSIRFALTALSVLACVRPAPAQQPPPKDLVPFKITVSGKAEAFPIPTDPLVMIGHMKLKGTAEPADLLGGEVTLTDTHLFRLGVDGTPNRSTNGMGVFQGPGGDAFFVDWDAVIRPTGTPNLFQGIASFTGRGGRGKFAGVVSSGTFTSMLNGATFEVTQVWEGLIAIPKK
jgi:hypothetical protein